MRLRELSIQTIPGYIYQKAFNSSVWCIKEMYWRLLNNFNTKDIAKIVIRLGEDNPNQRFGNILIINKCFDFENYFKCNTQKRKRIILELMHDLLMSVCVDQDVNNKLLLGAYKCCILHDLCNKWIFRDKYYISSDRQHYGAMECYWEYDHFAVTSIIYDRYKKEVHRKRLLKIEPYLGDFIYNCKCGWDNGVFFLESKDGNRWCVKMSEFRGSE